MIDDARPLRIPAGRFAMAAALAVLLAACSGAVPSVVPSGSPTASVSGATGSPGPSDTTCPSASACPAPSPTPSGTTVSLYFGRSDLDPCTEVVPVERLVDEATPEAALRALLKGPTSAETAVGYQSWFSAATADALASVVQTDGVVRVSFHDLRRLIPNASSSCGSGMLLNALDSTLGQFPGVSAARYSIEGDEAAFYEWLQMGVPGG